MTELNIIEENKLFLSLIKEESSLASKYYIHKNDDNLKAYLGLLEFISYLYLSERIEKSFVENNFLEIFKGLKEEINNNNFLEQLKELIIKLKI